MPQCEIEWKDDIHWILCPANNTRIDTIIHKTINKINKKNQLTNINSQAFVDNFIQLHLTRTNTLPIGIITALTSFPSQDQKIQAKLTTTLYHKIIKNIHKTLWKTSHNTIAKTTPLSNNTIQIPPPKPLLDNHNLPELKYRQWSQKFITYNSSPLTISNIT